MNSMTREELIDISKFKCSYGRVINHKRLHRRNVLLFGVWLRIRTFCGLISLNYIRTDRHYKNYGGRGIKVCDEWAKSYKAFRRWALLNGYRRGLSIDRIDRNGNYEPANCQWITVSENSRKANYYRWHVKPFEVTGT